MALGISTFLGVFGCYFLFTGLIGLGAQEAKIHLFSVLGLLLVSIAGVYALVVKGDQVLREFAEHPIRSSIVVSLGLIAIFATALIPGPSAVMQPGIAIAGGALACALGIIASSRRSTKTPADPIKFPA